MSVDLSELQAGRIVWAIVRDGRGFRKRRPAIILTPERDISVDQPLVLMAITTTYLDPPPEQYVELPWNRDRHRVSTGLARRSAAVTAWLDTVYPDEIDGVIGMVPSKIMDDIHRRLSKSQDSDT